ncbi:hypothetical protein EYF80_007194 [Liparis tanakae]|uniref:Uncharacterized protein n=1 Tax=Liparis tanakae TaxID=230148 RepID=A0A4Z2IXR2_9TELE|nr:hypothetical protein EYF80_007194 [Liparis tanakae]
MVASVSVTPVHRCGQSMQQPSLTPGPRRVHGALLWLPPSFLGPGPGLANREESGHICISFANCLCCVCGGSRSSNGSHSGYVPTEAIQ